MIAHQGALPALKAEAANLISENSGDLFADLKAAISGILGPKEAESQAQTDSETISTGLSSVASIRYSPKAEFTQMVFNLADMKLVGTGKLESPYRVYVDLQDIHWVPDSFRGIQTLKALDLDGDLVARVRIKKRESGITRIVLDLKRSCEFTYQVPQDSPSRLIVQLHAV